MNYIAEHVPANHYVYILECKDMTLYTGTAKNIEKRVQEHNNSRSGAKYTRGRRPVKLVYAEICPDFSAALKREAEIKTGGQSAERAIHEASG